MNQELERTARKNYRKFVREEQYEEFVNEFRILVWKSFYRFNNPKYRMDGEVCAFSTFSVHYLKQAAWRVKLLQYGVSDYTLRHCKHVRYVEELLAQVNGQSPEAVSDLEISRYLTQRYGKAYSEAEVRRIRNMMRPMSEIPEAYYEISEEEAEDRAWEPDEKIMKALEDFLSDYHALQIFVFLQNFGFCPDYYRDMTVQKLVQDPLFLRICRSDLKARKRIRTLKNARIGQSTEGIPGHRNIINLQLNEKYVFNMRLQIREEFSSYIMKRNMKPYQLRKNLDIVMHQAWEKLTLLYEI